MVRLAVAGAFGVDFLSADGGKGHVRHQKRDVSVHTLKHDSASRIMPNMKPDVDRIPRAVALSAVS